MAFAELRYRPAGTGSAHHEVHELDFFALDIPLVFGDYRERGSLSLTGTKPPAEFATLGDLMRREWLSFANCGQPGWAPYGTGHRTTRVYDLQPDVRSYPEEASMHLWERHMFDALDLPA